MRGGAVDPVASTLPCHQAIPPVLLHLRNFARLYWRLFLDRRVPILPEALLVLTVVYVVSPLDVIRDFIPVIGEMASWGSVPDSGCSSGCACARSYVKWRTRWRVVPP